jgi:hypothetical protein
MSDDCESNCILDLSLTTTASISSDTIAATATATAVAATCRSSSCDEPLNGDEDFEEDQDDQDGEEYERDSLPQEDHDEGCELDDDATHMCGASSVVPSSITSLCRYFKVHTKEIFSGGTYQATTTSKNAYNRFPNSIFSTAYLWKKCGNEYFSKRRFFWLDPFTVSLKWYDFYRLLPKKIVIFIVDGGGNRFSIQEQNSKWHGKGGHGGQVLSIETISKSRLLQCHQRYHSH